jgi:hypothetical protein
MPIGAVYSSETLVAAITPYDFITQKTNIDVN